MRLKHVSPLLASAALMLVGLAPALVRAQDAAAVRNPRPWLGHEQEYEDYLRNVEILSTTATGEGVTHPQKATLPPGGLTPYLAFKPIIEGPQNGGMESYRTEIAAYEIDKMLQLGMVPPVVEKVYKKQKGAAVYWLVDTKNFNQVPHPAGGAPVAPPQKQEFFSRQITRAKMFDCLIGNQDPNLGNWLIDADWNLFIIDHSRALNGDTTFPHKLNHIDRQLWDRMKALTLDQLTPPLTPWMSKGNIKSIIERRDKMTKVIADLIKSAGGDESKVFLRDGTQ
jgi:hypothetical protein